EKLSFFIFNNCFNTYIIKMKIRIGTRGGGTARIIFKNAEIPAENLIGELNGGYDVFNRMMIPERLTTAAGSLGVANAAIELAARYAMRRKAFGKPMIEHETINFMIAESITEIAHATALVYTAARAADAMERGEVTLSYVRKLVSMSKLNFTEVAWRVVNNAMQILGGIGYTTVYPIERFLRDLRLGMIWTGTNEIMKLIIQHEYKKEISDPELWKDKRNVKLDDQLSP
ncbi:MAG: acyl-CoA dehydrogenase, partial [Acidilobaceae archaeon]